MVEERESSKYADEQPKKCEECNGRGWKDRRCAKPDQSIVCSACNGRGTNFSGSECDACHGTGQMDVRTVDKERCPVCKGAGVYPIPPGLKEADYAYPRERGK